jgi:hypothetical protein
MFLKIILRAIYFPFYCALTLMKIHKGEEPSHSRMILDQKVCNYSIFIYAVLIFIITFYTIK